MLGSISLANIMETQCWLPWLLGDNTAADLEKAPPLEPGTTAQREADVPSAGAALLPAATGGRQRAHPGGQ